jgi:hypothetical protein
MFESKVSFVNLPITGEAMRRWGCRGREPITCY